MDVVIREYKEKKKKKEIQWPVSLEHPIKEGRDFVREWFPVL